MVNLLESIIEELNEAVLSGKFGVDEIYGDLIRRLFRESDDVRDYIFYEMDSETKDKYNLHKETPTENYLWNITESIWGMYNSWHNANEVDIGDDFDIDVGRKEITFSVTTLTAVSDPAVNYYDNGEDSIKSFIEELKDIIQINNIKYIEDWDCDDWGSIIRSGYIVVKIGK